MTKLIIDNSWKYNKLAVERVLSVWPMGEKLLKYSKSCPFSKKFLVRYDGV